MYYVPLWLSGKEATCNAGDAGDMSSIPRWRRSPGRENGNPLQYPGREKSHGQRRLAGYHSQGHKKSDTTEHTHTKQMQICAKLSAISQQPARWVSWLTPSYSWGCGALSFFLVTHTRKELLDCFTHLPLEYISRGRQLIKWFILYF